MEEEAVLCSEVGGQRKQQKVLADFISGQKVLAEEIQKQQKALAMRVEQQREVLSWQRETLNQLLAFLVSRPQTAPCYWCGQDCHFVRDCPKPPPANTQGDR